MNQSTHLGHGDVSSIIESERKRDDLVRRVCFIAWVVTLSVMLIFAVIVGTQVARVIGLVRAGVAPSAVILDAVVPLLGVVGGTSLLLALVSTAGVFLRFRTASLADIQLRLATLEAMLSEESGTDTNH